MATSMKGLAADPSVDVKKSDIYKVPPSMLVEESGFNLRNYDDPLVVAHIEGLATSYAAGVYVPPLIVRVDQDGQVLLIDGHCRRRGALLAISRGAEVPYLETLAFRGSDTERVEVMLRSAEGLKLTVLEQSIGYLRLHRMQHSNRSIADRMGKTTGRVEQMLLLAQANADVHEMVRAGTVTADSAIEAVRHHQDNAGAFLREKLGEAQQSGKGKVTRAVMRGPSLPPRIVQTMVGSVDSVMKSFDRSTRRLLAQYERLDATELAGKKIEVDAAALMALVKAQGEVQEANAKAEAVAAKRKAKSAQQELPVSMPAAE